MVTADSWKAVGVMESERPTLPVVATATPSRTSGSYPRRRTWSV